MPLVGEDDASRAFALDLGDPGRFASWIMVGGVVSDDPGHQCLEVGGPAELLVIDLTVGHHHPAQVSRDGRRGAR
jgi:hypothetical protein